jgi:cell division protein FtsL
LIWRINAIVRKQKEWIYQIWQSKLRFQAWNDLKIELIHVICVKAGAAVTYTYNRRKVAEFQAEASSVDKFRNDWRNDRIKDRSPELVIQK